MEMLSLSIHFHMTQTEPCSKEVHSGMYVEVYGDVGLTRNPFTVRVDHVMYDLTWLPVDLGTT